MLKRLTDASYRFVASYLPPAARQPSIVVAVGLCSTGILIAYLLSLVIGAIIAQFDTQVAGIVILSLFIGGNTLLLVGMLILGVGSIIDKLH